MRYLLAALLLVLAGRPAWAQIGSPTFDPMQNAAAPVRPADTATVRKPTAQQRRKQSASDSARRTERLFGWRVTKPTKAGLLAIVPGGGQVYNHKYWKLPIVYGVVGSLGYWVSYQARYYNYFRFAREVYAVNPDSGYAAVLRDSGHIPDANLRLILATYKRDNPAAIDNLLYGARRYLDLSILLSALGYSLTVLDAVVDAHLSEFDVSDDLSLRWQPGAIRVPGQATLAPGLTLTLLTR